LRHDGVIKQRMGCGGRGFYVKGKYLWPSYFIPCHLIFIRIFSVFIEGAWKMTRQGLLKLRLQ
jgi:hypothetical protein